MTIPRKIGACFSGFSNILQGGSNMFNFETKSLMSDKDIKTCKKFELENADVKSSVSAASDYALALLAAAAAVAP